VIYVLIFIFVNKRNVICVVLLQDAS